MNFKLKKQAKSIAYYKNEAQASALGLFLCLFATPKTQSAGFPAVAHQQIASRLNIPYRYYQKMQKTAPDFVRAFLSDRYRRLKAEVKVGDVVQAGFVVSNSEVGLGSLRVEPLVFRLVCKNGLICKDLAQKKYHVGRQVNACDDSA